jgi:hypothetical protein
VEKLSIRILSPSFGRRTFKYCSVTPKDDVSSVPGADVRVGIAGVAADRVGCERVLGVFTHGRHILARLLGGRQLNPVRKFRNQGGRNAEAVRRRAYVRSVQALHEMGVRQLVPNLLNLSALFKTEGGETAYAARRSVHLYEGEV